MSSLLLVLHILCGGLGLLIAFGAFFSKKRKGPHTILVFSYSFALVGYLAAKIKWKNWIRFHLVGQGGSFIAMVTALFVVNFGTLNLFVWFLPTIIGTPILIWFAKEVKAGRKPKYET